MGDWRAAWCSLMTTTAAAHTSFAISVTVREWVPGPSGEGSS